MSNVYRFVLVIALVVGLGFVTAGAQRDPVKLPLPPLPKEGGKVDLEFRGTVEDISLNDLIQLYVESTGRSVLWDPKRVVGTVTLTTPTKGDKPDLEELLQTALSQYRLCLVNTGKFDEIIPTAEAASIAEVVSIKDLETLPSSRFVRVVVKLNHVDANATMGALRHFVTRHSGTVAPVVAPVAGMREGGSLIVADTVNNLRRVLLLVAELDTPSRVSRVVTLRNVKLESAHRAIASAAGKEVIVGFEESGNHVVLTGAVAEVDRVAAVIEQIDRKPAD